MFVVALLALARTVEEEVPALAADLGVTPYDAGQLLRSGPPSILLRVADRERAAWLLARVRARGHDAVAFDASEVAASDVMPTVRSFTLEAAALVCACHGRPDERVEFPDLVALVRAVHQTRTESTVSTKQTSVSLGRLALSGGLTLTKTVTKEAKKSTDDREAVLYLFRRVGKPVLFGATRARYAGLGADVRPTQAENFERVIALLRERAPDAAYDARLVSLRVGVREKVSLAGASGSALGLTMTASSASAVDILAHTVALALARREAGPYRGR